MCVGWCFLNNRLQKKKIHRHLDANKIISLLLLQVIRIVMKVFYARNN